MTGKTMTGTVTGFNQKRGFGFATCDQDGISYFIHISQTGKYILKPGDRITFDVVVNPRQRQGVMAGNVVIDNNDDTSDRGNNTCLHQSNPQS